MNTGKRLWTKKWRRDRDSNPGYLAVYTLSKRAPSATRPSLRGIAGLFESNTIAPSDRSPAHSPNLREPVQQYFVSQSRTPSNPRERPASGTGAASKDH